MRIENPWPRALTFLFLVCLLAPAGPAMGASDGIWRDVDETLLAPLAPNRQIFPVRYRTLAVDQAGLLALLASAPLEDRAPLSRSQAVLSLPMPDGTSLRFRIENSPIMEPALAARHPEILTFRGQGVDDPLAAARLGWTTAGFHAIVRSRRGMSYIDRYAKGDVLHYISYYKEDYRTDKRMNCLFDGRSERMEPMGTSAVDFNNGGTRRTYRLALAANFEYSDFHSDALPPNKTDVLNNGIVPTINRVNFVYEQDFAVHMNLVANEEDIIFNTPADPYVNEEGLSMLVANQATCDAIIGQANYDIGHVFSTGGGGVAFLGVVCDASAPVQKAGGVTGNPAPVSDTFDIDYVAHEMGHQFGGNHTFNGTTGSCSGTNRSASHAYEVGSGSTIQAYAGICGAQNLQPHSDAYFHNESYREMGSFVFSGVGNSCGARTASGNTPPAVEAGPNYNIPARTPFELTAVASDPDPAEVLTYSWEERDLGPANAGTSDNGTSPILRSFSPTTSPTRTFPRPSDLLGNTTTYGELLPTTTRKLDFCVTVRDNRAGSGGVEFDCMRVNVTEHPSGFQVASPNGGETWTGGQAQTVTWDPANTTASPIDTPSVNILLSVDGGLTYPHVLASGVPNDGAQGVTAPNLSTGQARIKAQGAGNIFFDVSNSDFTIQLGEGPPVAVDDAFSTAAATPVTIAVLANDSDPDGDSIAITAVQSPTAGGGTAAVDDNGTPGVSTDDRIRYTPASGFAGLDTFSYTITAGGESDSAVVRVTVFSGCPPVPTGTFADDFEPGAAPGWSVDTPVNNFPVSPAWAVGADPQAHSATNSFSSDSAAADVKDDRLVSPPVDVSSTTQLVFWHKFAFESGFDGGVLEVSVGGGPWVDVVAGGGSFVSGGYNATISGGFESPIANRPAWSGNSPGLPAMNQVVVRLGAFAGNDVRVRWRLALDNGSLTTGLRWWIDDVQFSNLNEETDDCPRGPTAADDAASTDEDTAVVIDVTANDSDSNGDALTVTSVTDPANGTATDNGDGTVTYTPDPNFFGLDFFRYEVCDPGALCATAGVGVDVSAVNDPPVAADDSATTPQQVPVTVAVLSNDGDVEGDPLTVTSVGDPPHGAAAINADGTVTYTPDAGFTGVDSFPYSIGDGQGGSHTATVTVTVTAPPRDLRVSNVTTNGNKAREGDKVTITATVRNDGGTAAGPSTTRFRLDGATVLGTPATGPIPADGSVEVSIHWDTRGVKGDHVIEVTADAGGVVAESNEGNNTSSLTVTVQGNKVKNGSFEQQNADGTGPDGWSGSSTGAGTASWSEGGSDGNKSASTSGSGGNAAASGSPSWTSDPIAVVPGEVVTLAVSVQSLNSSSAASAGLVYLGAAGQVLNSVTLLTAPVTTSGFAKLERVVTVPAGVAQVRVKLVGFAPSDLRTAGTVRFDEVGLFGE